MRRAGVGAGEADRHGRAARRGQRERGLERRAGARPPRSRRVRGRRRRAPPRASRSRRRRQARACSSLLASASIAITGWPVAFATSSAAVPTPPSPTTSDRVAVADAGGVQHGAAAGQHRAAEQRGDLGRHGRRAPGRRSAGRRPRGPRTRRRRGGARPARRDGAAGCRRRAARPSAFAALPRSHGRRPSVAQAAHSPQRGRKVSTTRSPSATSCTAAPTRSTMPAASCPSSIGVGRGRLPSTTERSEWQMPAASMRTSSSVGPGSASSSSSIVQRPRVREGPGAAGLLEHRTGDPHADLLVAAIVRNRSENVAGRRRVRGATSSGRTSAQARSTKPAGSSGGTLTQTWPTPRPA